jgi:hypothetical protein
MMAESADCAGNVKERSGGTLVAESAHAAKSEK